MTWPQIVVALWLISGFAIGCHSAVKEPRYTSAMATACIAIYLIFYLGFAAVLSAGGFW